MSIAAAASASNTSSSSNQNALASLSSNFQDFLGMLMTQLQNQDPTSPLDTNQFTSELVQFSGVEQQINTNSALTQLIALTQSGQLLQSSSLIGRTVQVSSSQMPLQNGSGSLTLTAASAGTATISLANSAGSTVYSTTVPTTAGANTWTWNGQDANGTTLPDGPYTVSITGTDASGAASTPSFTVSGTVTNVVNNKGTLDVQLGSESVPFSSVQTVAN
jgi:flagellar basal-body rod modification protein FlgD